jgi:hypothetical protein
VEEHNNEYVWHFDKTVSISNLVGILALAAGGFAAYDTITDRVSVLETNMDNLNHRVISLVERQINTDTQQDESLQQFRAEMREDVRAIQQKLDRIIEGR